MEYFTIIKKSLSVLVLATSFLCISCAEEKKEEAVNENSEIGPAPGSDTLTNYVDTELTAQNSLDYAGIYKGVTPCADCEGIETKLTLEMDSSFVLSQKYLGKGDDAIAIRVGKYQWIDNGIIELVGISDGAGRFKVGEGRIWQLDTKGKVIEGMLADKYVLKKS